jgi:GNAT superfamily N-acetyltransferase
VPRTDAALRIRTAVAGDARIILAFIRELAEYERLAGELTVTEDDLRGTMFGDRPFAECRIAEVEGHPAGFALYFHNYSTFLGRPGLYLEDLFVRPSFRGRGIGGALLTDLARIAVERGCGRLEWSVLDWNEPALRFYRSRGAVAMEGWTVHRLAGEALRAVARDDQDPETAS